MKTVTERAAGANTEPLPATAARSRACPLCDVPAGQPCQPDADHLLRYAEARRQRLITEADMAAALTAADIVTVSALIPGGAL